MPENYAAARKRGLKEVKEAEAQGRSPYPEVLDEILKDEGRLPEIKIGLMEIPLDMIAGTKTAGRTNSFSCGFMPILDPGSEFAAKWSSLCASQMEEGIREPIKVYEYMTRFYVEEGNKRVSVSRYVGATDIHANVTRIMPRKTNTKEYRVYCEFLEYFNVAGIYDVTFTREGSYRLFARCVGQTLDARWPKERIQDIQAAYAVFTQIYGQERARRWSGLPAGDAFLRYLDVYPLESLLDEPRHLLENRVNRLWGEFMVESRADNVDLLETPGDTDPVEEPGALGNLGSALRMLNPIDRARGAGQRQGERVRYTAENPLHMAFLYPRSPEDSAWIYGHELGRSDLESKFGGAVNTWCYEDCGTDEKIRAAVDDAVSRHAELVFTISPTQMAQTLRSAIHYPDVKFLNCSVNLKHSAVRTYYGRMHEAKFLMGVLAATVTENHRIGYVADYPIYGIVAGINAFAIGASLVDPLAEVHLKWSTDQDGDWRREFEEEDVQVISALDSIKPRDASREYGLYQRLADGSIRNLAAPVWNWGRYYELIARIVMNGRWDLGGAAQESRAVNYWWGMSAGVIDVLYSEKLPYSTCKLLDMLHESVTSGRYDPFMGELHTQSGEVLHSRWSHGLSANEIVTMNWLSDNVVGSLPKKSELKEEAGAAVDVSGVEGVADEAGEEPAALAAAGVGLNPV